MPTPQSTPQISTQPGVRHNREYRDARIADDYLAGHTTYAIAGVFNLTRPRICQILHERGIPARKWRNRDVTPKQWTTDRQFRQLLSRSVG